jgi:hypothetical protein
MEVQYLTSIVLCIRIHWTVRDESSVSQQLQDEVLPIFHLESKPFSSIILLVRTSSMAQQNYRRSLCLVEGIPCEHSHEFLFFLPTSSQVYDSDGHYDHNGSHFLVHHFAQHSDNHYYVYVRLTAFKYVYLLKHLTGQCLLPQLVSSLPQHQIQLQQRRENAITHSIWVIS